jgi:hypothetical protein
MNQDMEPLRLLEIFHYVTAGRSLALRKRYSVTLAIACIECLFVPFGTILGAVTIVALSRESVKRLFATAHVQPPG